MIDLQISIRSSDTDSIFRYQFDLPIVSVDTIGLCQVPIFVSGDCVGPFLVLIFSSTDPVSWFLVPIFVSGDCVGPF